MFDNYAIIPHSHTTKILLIASNDTWSLPQHQYVEASDINCAIHEQFGLDATTLSCVYDRYKYENSMPYWLRMFLNLELFLADDL